MELCLGNIDPCRKLYEKYLEWSPENCYAWSKYTELEKSLDETERARAIFELAIAQPILDLPEFLWKSKGNVETATHGGIDSSPILITSHKLNGHNYLQWSQSVMMFICGKGKHDYLTGEEAMPEVSDPSFKRWKSENNMIMSWLINSMNNDISENFLLFGTTKDIWDAAKETYSSSKNTSKLFQIETILYDFRQGEKSVRSRVLGTKPLPHPHEAFSEVRHEESRKKVMMVSSEPTLDASALAARASNSVGVSENRTKKERSWCDHCPSTTDNQALPEPNPFSKEQMKILQKLFDQATLNSNAGTSLVAQKETHSAFAATNGASKPWIVDTGAFDHMTGDASMLQDYKASINITSVRITDGSHAKIAGTCSIRLTKELHINSDLDLGKTIGSAELCSGLYLLKSDQSSFIQDSRANCAKSNSLSTSYHHSIVSPNVNNDSEIVLLYYRLANLAYVHASKLFGLENFTKQASKASNAYT
ncbi:hypothetical protein WN943_000345 [Citrus x changshan-huyou]